MQRIISECFYTAEEEKKDFIDEIDPEVIFIKLIPRKVNSLVIRLLFLEKGDEEANFYIAKESKNDEGDFVFFD